MYQDLGGKLTGISITGDLEDKQKTMTLRKSQMDSLIGVEIPEKDIENYLKKLNFRVLRTKGDAFCAWEVVPPYYRLDVEIEADVIEEVARMYGYEKIPPKELVGETPAKIDQSLFEFIYNTKVILAKTGLTEVQLYSFYSTQVLNNLGMNKEELIRVVNPMSSETEYMRNELWPNLVECVAKNLRNGYEEVAIFEINRVYIRGAEPKEEYHLVLALSNDNPENIKQLYGLFEKINQKIELGIKLGSQEMEEREKDLFHPVRFWQLLKDGKRVGKLAEIHPRVANKFGLEKRVYILEINIWTSF